MSPARIAVRNEGFLISVGEPRNGFEVLRHGISAEPGFRTRIKVIPSQVVATDDLKSLPLEARHCRYNIVLYVYSIISMHSNYLRFPDENENMKLFKNYSLDACQF